MRLGEKGHRVDDLAEHHRGPLAQQQEEPAAHRIGGVGAPAGAKGHLDIRREQEFGGENLGEVLYGASGQRMTGGANLRRAGVRRGGWAHAQTG